MNKTLRTLISLALALLMCVSVATVALAEANIPSATSDFYVNDFAGVLSELEKIKLMNSAVSLANEHNGIQVVVTTVKSLEGESVEEYAYKMYNQYGIGKEDMGLLILLATEDRQIRVEVGRAMEGYINDAKAGRFLDKYAIPYLKENKFNEGLINLQQAFIAEIKDCINSENTIENNDSMDITIDWGVVLFTILIVVASGGVIWIVILAVNKVRKKKQEKEQYIQDLKDEISSQDRRIAGLNSTLTNKQRENDNLRREIEIMQEDLNDTNQSLITLRNRHKRILTIYPDADEKVDKMIEAEKVARDKAEAERVDELIASVINLAPDKDLVSRLTSIKREASSLSEDEVKYLKSDMTKFNNLYSKCCALKIEYDEQVERERVRRRTEQRKAQAASITKQLLGIIAMVGVAGANDVSRLKNAQSLYEGLDRETRSYVDSSAISQIEDLLRRAKLAKRRAEEEEERRRREEEERRRRQSLNSTSSYRPGSGGFGGFGGRSGGGGASRGF